MTEAKIKPVRKAHRVALAIWEDAVMKQQQRPKTSHVTRYAK
jgi:hypothetical protein